MAFSQSLSLVRSEAECSSLQRAGIPPSPSRSHKYLPACDWKYICKNMLSVGFMCSTQLLLAAGASPSRTLTKRQSPLGNMHMSVHTYTHVSKQAGSV